MIYDRTSRHGSDPSLFSPEQSRGYPPNGNTRSSSSVSLLSQAIALAMQAGCGYLCAKLFKQVDPLTGALCGAVNSIAWQLLIAPKTTPTQARKIGTLAIASLAPFATCRLLDLPISFKASFAIGFGSLLPLASVGFLLDALSKSG